MRNGVVSGTDPVPRFIHSVCRSVPRLSALPCMWLRPTLCLSYQSIIPEPPLLLVYPGTQRIRLGASSSSFLAGLEGPVQYVCCPEDSYLLWKYITATFEILKLGEERWHHKCFEKECTDRITRCTWYPSSSYSRREYCPNLVIPVTSPSVLFSYWSTFKDNPGCLTI